MKIKTYNQEAIGNKANGSELDYHQIRDEYIVLMENEFDFATSGTKCTTPKPLTPLASSWTTFRLAKLSGISSTGDCWNDAFPCLCLHFHTPEEQ